MHGLHSLPKTLQSERFIPILLGTWLTYASYSMLRRPLSIVRSKMISDGDMTIEESGAIDTCFLIFYTIGQLYYTPIRAALSKLTSRKILALGLGASSVIVFLFGVLPIHSALLRCLLWCLLGLAQAVGWASCLVVLTPWLSSSERGRLMGLWGTNMALGGVLGNTISSFVLKSTGGSWVSVFVACAGTAGVISLSLPFWLGGHPNTQGILTSAQEAKVEKARDDHVGRSDFAEESFFDKQRVDLEGEWTFVKPPPADPVVSSVVNTVVKLMSNHGSNNSKNSSENSTTNNNSSGNSPSTTSMFNDDNNGENSSHHSSTTTTTKYADPSLHVSKIPGVLGIAISYFFHKLVRYVLMMWMPFYLSKQLKLDSASAGFMATSFDIGGVIGTVSSGYLADFIGGGTRKAATASFFGAAMAFTLFLFASGINEPSHRHESAASDDNNSGAWATSITLLLCFFSGAFAFGIDSLMTGSLLQDHCDKLGASTRIGAVGAFVGAVGTLGSILQGPFTVFLSGYSWSTLFMVMVLMTATAIGCLIPVVRMEIGKSK